jgi:hypothetical protein
MGQNTTDRLDTNFPRTGSEHEVEVTESSGLLTSDTAVMPKAGILVALVVITDGTNNATAIVYDNASTASGTVLAKVVVTGSDNMGGELKINAIARNGLFLDISGTGAEAIVRFID